MKKFLILILIVALVILAYFFWPNEVTNNPPLPNNTTDSGLRPDASNATFTIDDEAVTLSSGKNENEVAPGSIEETLLLDKFAYGDLNADGKDDTALLLVRYGSGSGTFIYTAAYLSGPVNYKGTDALFIGDRIAPKSVSISQGVVTVSYLDRKADEPLSAEPTISKSIQFIVRGGEFVEK